jgi:crotonobetainyl-CoA:carnitine CoA-transferase CaiB-like acyl-CoA transferase
VSGFLEGVRAVELGLFALVPAAAAVLAEWGADVIKIEHPVQGDPVRGLTEEVLLELGFDWEAISSLKSNGAVL